MSSSHLSLEVVENQLALQPLQVLVVVGRRIACFTTRPFLSRQIKMHCRWRKPRGVEEISSAVFKVTKHAMRSSIALYSPFRTINVQGKFTAVEGRSRVQLFDCPRRCSP